MTRDELAAYLDAHFAPLALAADPEAAAYDPIDYYAVAIDGALRALGTAEADLGTTTVAAASVADYVVLGEYYALVLLCRRLAPLVDTTSADQGRKLSQVYTAARALLAEAKTAAAGRGYAAAVGTGAAAVSSGRLVLDSIEPERFPADF